MEILNTENKIVKIMEGIYTFCKRLPINYVASDKYNINITSVTHEI